MTDLLTEAPELVEISVAERSAPTAFSRPLSFRVRLAADLKVSCRVQRPAPMLAPPAVRVRALDTGLAAVAGATGHVLEAPGATKAAAAVLANQAANVAFFLSRRPSMLGAKHHGKFRA